MGGCFRYRSRLLKHFIPDKLPGEEARKQLKSFKSLSPESQGQNVAVTVVYERGGGFVRGRGRFWRGNKP